MHWLTAYLYLNGCVSILRMSVESYLWFAAMLANHNVWICIGSFNWSHFDLKIFNIGTVVPFFIVQTVTYGIRIIFELFNTNKRFLGQVIEYKLYLAYFYTIVSHLISGKATVFPVISLYFMCSDQHVKYWIPLGFSLASSLLLDYHVKQYPPAHTSTFWSVYF